MNLYDAGTHAPRRGKQLRTSVAGNGRHLHQSSAAGPAAEREICLAALGRWFVHHQILPTLLIDEQSNLLLMNHAVHALLLRTSIFRLVGATLVWRSASHVAELNCLIRQQLQSVSIPARIDNGVVPVIISRIAVDGESGALLLISVRVDLAGQQGDRIRREYGLTQAEAEIAVAIFCGSSRVGIARQRCASLNTVKTQVRAVFRKFRVHSKVELTRRLGEIMPAE
jgi:DNA-binding CsgD family transcriptional regulator